MGNGIIRDAETLQRLEEERLSRFATPSSQATRPIPHASPEPGYRLPFQRDRDRIIHSRAFRRLKHKTQVFVPHLGDHPRTRLTHTLEVSQIARTIARTLGLNEDLVEAIALGHDLGHTAFGHTGEVVLDELLSGRSPDFALPPSVASKAGRFKHNYQSVRVVDLLERRYDHPGLNLTNQVREGILKHTRWDPDFQFPLEHPEELKLDLPCHLEGQVVAIADEIAQQTHDLEDGLRGEVVALEEVEKTSLGKMVKHKLGTIYQQAGKWRKTNMMIRGLIDTLVAGVVEATARKLEELASKSQKPPREELQDAVCFPEELRGPFEELVDLVYRLVINHSQVNRQDWRARKVLAGLFKAYWTNPMLLPPYVLLRAKEELSLPYLKEVPFSKCKKVISEVFHTSPGFARLVADHIAGMSDRYALEEYAALEMPGPQTHPGGGGIR